jgi:hypothetical protein
MKKLIILILVFISCNSFSQVNPWESIGKEAPEILTLTNGEYPEIFENDSIRIISGIVYNTITKKVIGFVEKDTLYSEATLEPEIVSRWLSRDPLAIEYPGMSPYNSFANNPILFVDPNGAEFILYFESDDGGIYQFSCFLETETAGNVSARVARRTEDGGYVIEFINSNGEKITGENFASQDFYKTMDKNDRIMVENLVKVQDDKAKINYTQSKGGAGVENGAYNRKNEINGSIAQIFDLQDLVKIEKLTGGEISAEALFAHEVIEGYLGQTEGDNFPDHHAVGLNVQAEADGFTKVTAFSFKNKNFTHITTETTTLKGNVSTTVTTLYKIETKNGNPIKLMDKTSTTSSVTFEPLETD